MWFLQRVRRQKSTYFCQNHKNPILGVFSGLSELYWPDGILFFQNIGLRHFLLYEYLTSCKKLEKTVEPMILRCKRTNLTQIRIQIHSKLSLDGCPTNYCFLLFITLTYFYDNVLWSNIGAVREWATCVTLLYVTFDIRSSNFTANIEFQRIN